MGIDHTTTGSDDPSENVEQVPAPDRPPPPPPDKPGSEGYPSRADSRAGAAAANTTDQPTSTSAYGEARTDDAVATSSNGGKPERSDRRDPAAGEHPNEAQEPSAQAVGDARPDLAAASAGTADQPTPQSADAVEDRDGIAPADRPATSVTETAEGRDGIGSRDSIEDAADALGGEPTPPDSSATVPEIVRDADSNSVAVAATAAEAVKADNEVDPTEALRQRTIASDTSAPSESEPSSGPEIRAVAREGAADIIPTSPSDEAPMAERPTDARALTTDQAVDGEHSRATDAVTSPEPTTAPPTETGDRHTDDVTVPEGPVAVPGTNDDAQDRPADFGGEGQQEGADLVTGTGTTGDDSAGAEADRSESGTPMNDADQAVGPRRYDILVQDLPLEAYLDRTAGDYRSADQRETPLDEPPDEGPIWVEKRSDLPSGNELRDMDSDKLSRLDRLRKEGYRKLNDALDVTEKGFDLGADAFGRPPTHSETRSVEPHVVEAPHHGVTAGDAATGLLAAGVVFGEVLRAAREKMLRRKRERNADSR